MSKLLVVVDMQNDFINGPLGNPEARAIVPKVAWKMREFDGCIVCTMDMHNGDYLSTQEGRNLPVPHCIKGTYGQMLQKDIADAALDMEASKLYKTTFGSLNLGYVAQNFVNIMKNHGTPCDEIILVGLCTDICVISNALILKAMLPEVKITVDASCCAGTTPEAHKAALTAMKSCQVFIENE